MGRIDKNPILSEDSVVAAKIFKNIAGLWKLTIDEQLKVLGGMTEQEFKNCFVKSNKELSSGALDRISYIMGI